jgi:hypothetical protein
MSDKSDDLASLIISSVEEKADSSWAQNITKSSQSSEHLQLI